jgi:hypothetical protein
MKPSIHNIIFHEEKIKEYETLGISDEIFERVYLENKIDREIHNVSKNHWVLCLDPLIFGVWITKDSGINTELKEGWSLRFTECGPLGEKKKTLAVASLDLFDRIIEDSGSLLLLKIKTSRIFHIHFLKTWLLYLKYYKKPGLSFRKLKTFVTAYSYPRKVRLISFKEENYYNIFPMDLLGDISDQGRFVLGLRHTNHALARIIAAGKIVVSEISCSHKEIIYKLGMHHGSKPPPTDQLPFKVVQSKVFEFWIPEWAETCKEIRIIRTINLGSHMLLWGEPVSESRLHNGDRHLHHIHFLLYLQQKAAGFSYQSV